MNRIWNDISNFKRYRKRNNYTVSIINLKTVLNLNELGLNLADEYEDVPRFFFPFLSTSKAQWTKEQLVKKLGLSGAILSPKIQDQDREKISAGNPADYACTTCLSYDRVKSFSFSWLLCRLSSIPFQRKYLALISHNTGHLSASSHRFRFVT